MPKDRLPLTDWIVEQESMTTTQYATLHGRSQWWAGLLLGFMLGFAACSLVGLTLTLIR